MIQLIKGDCLVEMKTIADNSVDAIVTDPPYGLSFMGYWTVQLKLMEIKKKQENMYNKNKVFTKIMVFIYEQ